MNTQKLIKILTLAFVPVFVLAAVSANAATCSVSAEAPSINNFDIANYGSSVGTDKWWTEHGAMGQTITTGDMATKLNSITYEISDSQSAEITKTWIIRVCTITKVNPDDSSTWILNPVYTETATQDNIQWIGTVKAANTGVDAAPFMTWSLDSPLTLSVNTEYAIDVGLSSSTSGWTTGIPYIKRTGNEYAGGTRYISGTSGVGSSSMGSASGDRIFHVDLTSADPASPIVDAGGNWATWLGNPISIDATAIAKDPNNPDVNLIFNWTAETEEGFDVAISDPTVEDPTVTITRITPFFWEIPIKDASFENSTMSPDGQMKWFKTSDTSWRFADPEGTAYTTDDNKGAFGQLFLWNPKPGIDVANWNRAGFNGVVPDGDNCVIVGSILRNFAEGSEHPGGLAKLLVSDAYDSTVYPTYDPTSSYELSAYIGHTDITMSTYYGYKVELLAGGSNENSSNQYTHKVVGGTVIGSVTSTDPITPETWEQVTVNVGPDPVNAGLAGEPLQIRITSLKNPADPNTQYIMVDNISLMTDAPRPVESVTMELKVNNEGSTTAVASDSILIKVYENACDLTKDLVPEKIEVTDFNVDCVTNIADFAVLAEDWMYNYALTEPQPALVE